MCLAAEWLRCSQGMRYEKGHLCLPPSVYKPFLLQVEEQPIHTVSEHAELEGRTRTCSRDDQAPPRRHRYSKACLQTDLMNSVSYSNTQNRPQYLASHQARVTGNMKLFYNAVSG
jgi:hypothetical protein